MDPINKTYTIKDVKLGGSMRYHYGISSGVKVFKTNTKKYVIGTIASLIMVAGMSAPTLAAGAGDGSKAAPCGSAHGAFADTNGNFGFLGAAGGTPGYHGGATGQDAGATGYNNSHTSCQQ